MLIIDLLFTFENTVCSDAEVLNVFSVVVAKDCQRIGWILVVKISLHSYFQ